MNIFEQLNKLKEEEEVEDKDIILDSIESLTRFTNVDGKEIPDFCRFKAIQDNFGISDKELLDLAKNNGYNVFKIITENNSEFVIAHPDCSEEVIKEAVFDDETPIKVDKVEFKEVSEMIEKKPDIKYKGFTIEHSPMEMHYGDRKQDVDGWYIHSPYYLQSNQKKEKFFLPLFAEDEFGVVQNFKTAEEAKEYIDKWIVTKKGKIKLKGWKKDECYFEILPEYRKEKEVDEKLLKEYTTYWPGEKEYPVRWDWGEYDPHTGSFANGKTLDDITPDDYPDEEDEEPSGWSEEYTNEETVEEGDEYKITKCDVVIHPFSKKQKDIVKHNKYVVYFRRYKQASNGGTYLNKEHWYEHGGGGYYYDTLERARKVVTDYGHKLKESKEENVNYKVGDYVRIKPSLSLPKAYIGRVGKIKSIVNNSLEVKFNFNLPFLGDDKKDTIILHTSEVEPYNNNLKESKEEKLETFEDKMNFLAKDEQEAIDGYNEVIAMLDSEKDAFVIEQLTKIKIEEEAHKKYLEDVIKNKKLEYTEPLEQEDESIKEEKENQYFLCSVYGGYNCQVLLADNIEVYAKNEEQAKKEAIKIYKQEYDYSRKDNPFGLEAKIIKDDDLEEDIDELIYKVAEKLKNNINSFEDELITLSQIEGVDVEEIKQREPMQIAKALVEEGIVDFRMFENIEKHETLNPLIFEGNKLKPEIREAMQKIADAFVDDLKEDDISIKVNDIILVGSNCSYNYTKDSDLDIHIIADSSALECPKELVDKLYSAYRSIFNKNYDITIKGIPAEIYVELDKLGAAKSNGIYSILKDKWLKEPVQQDIPDLDQEAFDALFSEWENRYFDLVGGQTIDEPDFVDTADELGESKTMSGADEEWDYYEIYCEKGEEIEYSNDNFSLCIKVKHGTPTPEEEDVEEFFKENYPEVIKDYHVVGVWDTINDFADDELSLGDFETVYTYTAPVLASNSGELKESLFDDIDKFITDVYDLRKTSISKEGEYGLGNLVFKELRNLGYLDNLKELKKQERAKELSLEQLGESSGQSKKVKRVKGVLFGKEDRHHTFCVMTPENPMNKKFSDKDNLPLIKEFRQGLRDDSITFTPISGKYGNKERSFFLYDVTLEKSKELAKKYGQESFFFGKVNKDANATVQFWERSDEDSDYKMIEENDKIDINQERDNYYSIVGNKFKFSFDMDYFK